MRKTTNSREALLNSLDVDDADLLPFIPYLLQDLWAMGSMPEYMLALVRNHIPAGTVDRVLHLGCGKGAVLIQLCKQFGFRGVGIDIFPSFIAAARVCARQWNCARYLTFETGDIVQAVEQHKDYDLVIYGQDTDILGNVAESLKVLKKCISSEGFILLESAFLAKPENKVEHYPDEQAFTTQLYESGLQVLDMMLWEVDILKAELDFQSRRIGERVRQLIQAKPDKEKLLNSYLEKQISECRMIEKNLKCATILLKRRCCRMTV